MVTSRVMSLMLLFVCVLNLDILALAVSRNNICVRYSDWLEYVA
jgi:hypothetical protein